MARFTVLLLPDEKTGGFTVEVPTLPGVITEGDTREEALANAQEAISLFIEDIVADGEQIPRETLRPELAEVEIELEDRSVIVNRSFFNVAPSEPFTAFTDHMKALTDIVADLQLTRHSVHSGFRIQVNPAIQSMFIPRFDLHFPSSSSWEPERDSKALLDGIEEAIEEELERLIA